MGKTSTSVKRKYNVKTYKRLAIDLKKDEFDVLEEHCRTSGESKNGVIRRLIRECLGGNYDINY